jgi:hypothetical protein
MNKAAPKEPSMDEILSSIRQIIADDDASITPRPAPVQTGPAPAPMAVPKPAPIASAAPAASAKIDFDLDDLPSFKPAGEAAGQRFPIIPPAPKPVAAPKTSLADVLGTLSDAAPVPVVEAEDEPLALSATQIVTEDEPAEEEAFSFASLLADEAPEAEPEVLVPELVVPEDVAFAPEPEPDFPAFAPVE